MMSEYQEWLTEQRTNGSLPSISDSDSSHFVDFLNEEVTAADAVDRLVTGRSSADKNKARRKVFGLAVHTATEFPDSHRVLVGFLKELFYDSSVDTTGFGWDLRSLHDALQCDVEDMTRSSGRQASAPLSEAATQLKRRWTNFHAFMAKCRSADTVSVGEGFMILAAETSLEVKATAASKARIEMDVPAAAAWLAYAPGAILAACRANAKPWTESCICDTMWKSPDGFSVDRWNFWKRRLEEVRQAECSEDTNQLLRQAFVNMEKAERAKVKK